MQFAAFFLQLTLSFYFDSEVSKLQFSFYSNISFITSKDLISPKPCMCSW